MIEVRIANAVLQEALNHGADFSELYLEDTDRENLSRLETLAAEKQLPITVTKLPDTNWEESWKDSYPPQPIGEHLIVLPYWLADQNEGRLPVILDPGLTFGTGAHPSTRMVMVEMEKFVRPGFRCLDLGSGSGILSLTALRLGAESAIGMDIDPKAEDIARENAAYNGFSAPAFTALTGNVTEDRELMAELSAKEYDLVLVNIVADVIISLAPVLPHFLRKDSLLICSGIVDYRLPDVVFALGSSGISVKKVREEEDWCCIVCQLK